MQISLGFLVVLILVLLPGLIYRRLYFYGEFSKEFRAGHNLISLLAISSIPGLIMFLLSCFLFDTLFMGIDIGEIIDKLKDIKDPEFKFTKSDEPTIKELLKEKVAPFIGFLYSVSTLLGAMTGRFIRISRLDTKFKLLRFKNYWFYLFNDHHTGLKKFKHLRRPGKKYLFTKADILIDSNNNTHLYSGIVVDYELRDDNCRVLSKVMLENAERYKLKDNKRISVSIPGSLLVVDCAAIKNINLTYIYEKTKGILETKIPVYIETIIASIIIILAPIYIFQSESITWGVYVNYFKLEWYQRMLIYLLSTQILGLCNPFIRDGQEFKLIPFRNLIVKVIFTSIIAFLVWVIN